MMAKVFAKNLSSKQVMTTDGTELGTLYNITMDLGTSELVDLMIRPDMNIDTSEFQKDDQYILLPFESVRAIKDYIVVDKKIAKGLQSGE